MSAGGRSLRSAWLLLGALALAGWSFAALGVWQLQRREWKLQLIATVEERVAADPAPLHEILAAPGSVDIEYRRVSVSGAYLPVAPTLTQAVTRLGAGYWVLQPFRSDAGITVFMNRGFVPTSARATVPAAPTGHLDLLGLLRRSEPAGGFLRRNDPAANRWFSRDISAIARTARVPAVEPWFIDVESTSPGASQPVGGLTVVQFRNAHLTYALTWFGLAALTALAGGIVWRAGKLTLRSQPQG